MPKITYKVGDIIEIPLPNGDICIGRMYRDSTIGIYKNIQSMRDKNLNSIEPDLVAGVFTTDFKKCNWKIISNQSFEHDGWPPPTWKRDILNSKKIDIYERGEFRNGSENEIINLHPALMYKPDQLAKKILET